MFKRCDKDTYQLNNGGQFNCCFKCAQYIIKSFNYVNDTQNMLFTVHSIIAYQMKAPLPSNQNV